MLLGAGWLALTATSAHAQTKLAWEYTGSVSGPLSDSPNVVPNLYYFDGLVGETYISNTSLNAFDATIRVVGPNAKVSFFN